MSENITPSDTTNTTPTWFQQENTTAELHHHHHHHLSNRNHNSTEGNIDTNTTNSNITDNNNDDMTHDFIHKGKFDNLQPHQLHLEEMSNWTDFTNLGELDFSLLEEHLLTLNKNNNGNHHHHIQQQQLQQQQQQQQHTTSSQQDKEFAEFSHTLFPPIETTPHEDADFQYSNVEQDEDEHLQSLVRPDLIFTPLVSPLVTPLDKIVSSSSSSSYQNTSRRHVNQQDSNGIFSPLTSPLLEFQKIKSSPIMRIKKDTHDDSIHSHHHRRKSTASSSNNNNKTPGSTPIVGPSMPGRVTKLSPVVKPKRHSSITATGKYLGDIKLPESVMDFKTPSSVPRRISKQQQQQQYQQQQQQQYVQQQQQQQQQQQHISHSDENGHPVTPATLMNFKMENNDQELQQQQQQQQTVILNTNREHSNSSSPVILPSSAPVPMTMGPRRSSSISSRRQSSRRNSNSPSITSLNNNNKETVPTTTTTTTTGTATTAIDQDESQEFQYDKKTNHKLAEQGRRNRMNNAIQNLDKLIPQDWKKNVVVPSKLTTIEIAIEYIKTLQRENLQQQDNDQDYENGVHHHHHHHHHNNDNNNNNNINNTSDSISPFD